MVKCVVKGVVKDVVKCVVSQSSVLRTTARRASSASTRPVAVCTRERVSVRVRGGASSVWSSVWSVNPDHTLDHVTSVLSINPGKCVVQCVVSVLWTTARLQRPHPLRRRLYVDKCVVSVWSSVWTSKWSSVFFLVYLLVTKASVTVLNCTKHLRNLLNGFVDFNVPKATNHYVHRD